MPDRRRGQSQPPHRRRGRDDRQQRERNRGPKPGTDEHDRGDRERDADRGPVRMLGEVTDRLGRHHRRIAARGSSHTERAGDLLQPDHARDAEGEAFDHRHWDVGHGASGTQQGQRHEDDAGHQADRHDAVDPVRVHDRDQDNRHRARRTGDLEVGAAEDRGQRPGDHRRHQPGLRPGPRGDAEPERQRQRHHRDRQSGDQVAAWRAPHRAECFGVRQDRLDTAHDSVGYIRDAHPAVPAVPSASRRSASRSC
jgi:hypothetical protein